MHEEFESRILKLLKQPDYRPLTLKKLAAVFETNEQDYPTLRASVKSLVNEGKIELRADKTLALPGSSKLGTIVGTFKRTARGFGFVRPIQAVGREQDIFVSAQDSGDASTGDEVSVKIKGRGPRAAGGPAKEGRIVKVINRARGQFVGTYFEKAGKAFVRPDGGQFRDPILVGDPGAKRAQPNDKVAFEMVRYPSSDRGGEGVITEVLGARGQPGVDTLSVLRAFSIPDEFEPEVLEEARKLAEKFDESDIGGRLDLRETLVVTIDPATAHDFDDAISLSRDERGFWNLGVHIADVGHFVREGSALDKSAQKRGTSVYLPGRVVPMLPEVLSNGLASLQAGRARYTMSAFLQFDAEGRRTHHEFTRSVIRVARRFTYEEAFHLMMHPEAEAPEVSAEIRALLARMLELARILRKRRMARGALELVMPEVEVELDADGRVAGAHLASDDESHQVIEEFMLAANEAVAEHLSENKIDFLRRVHPDPEPSKLLQFAEFVGHLGCPIDQPQSRFELQRVLAWSNDRPERHAVHFGLLRSLKQATYTIEPEEHFALASANYCHFTSPIRRYPDLQVHRQLAAWLAHKKPRSRPDELAALAEHCTRAERRAEAAERDLIRIKLLTYLEPKIGMDCHAVVIGVEDFGVFCQLVELPVEGLLHVTNLGDDFYYLEPQTHTLVGRRSGRKFRLGDRIEVRIARVDVDRRELDLVTTDTELHRMPANPTRRGRPPIVRSEQSRPQARGKSAKTGRTGRGKPSRKKKRR